VADTGEILSSTKRKMPWEIPTGGGIAFWEKRKKIQKKSNVHTLEQKRKDERLELRKREEQFYLDRKCEGTRGKRSFLLRTGRKERWGPKKRSHTFTGRR